MRVAILMPAYNETTALAEALRSLGDLVEPLGGVTVFLVDDGSLPPIGPGDCAAALREAEHRSR